MFGSVESTAGTCAMCGRLHGPTAPLQMKAMRWGQYCEGMCVLCQVCLISPYLASLAFPRIQGLINVVASGNQ
jgi:hypothetical protein